MADRAGYYEHEVHTHVGPRSRWHWKRCVEASVLLDLLGEGAHPALSDDVPNIVLQAQPIKLMFYGRNHLVMAKMTGKTSRRDVRGTHNLFLKNR